MAHSNGSGFLKISYEDICEQEYINNWEFKRNLPFASSEVYQSTVIDAKKLTHGLDVKNVYDLAIDIKGVEYSFRPGDTIGVFPENNEAEVNQVFALLNCLSVVDKKYTLAICEPSKKKIPLHIPVRSTLRNVFLKYVDLRSPPKKAFLGKLVQFITNEDEVKKISELCSLKSSDEYFKFITAEGSTLLGLLKTFPSCKPPVETLLEHLPPLQPRPYSISSSPLLKDELHITFSVIHRDDHTKGTCTGWLENIAKVLVCDSINDNLSLANLSINDNQNTTVNFYFRKTNAFRLPDDVPGPVVMVGPGTGVSPFMGFLQHLHLEGGGKSVYTWLFFGCRYSDRDYLFRSNLNQYLKSGVLKKLSVAFSRNGDKKEYVQDLMKRDAKELHDKLIEENGIMYVCGDAKNMLKDVRSALSLCLSDASGCSLTEAEIMVSDLEKSNRYIEDKWL